MDRLLLLATWLLPAPPTLVPPRPFFAGLATLFFRAMHFLGIVARRRAWSY